MNSTASARKRILFVGLISPPVSGQSLACDVLLEDIRATYDVDVINLNRDDLNQRKGVLRQIWVSLQKILTLLRLRGKADLIYFTGGESIVGNLKDVLFYLACVGKLDRVVMHLHGGAGMRRLMRGPTGFFRWLNWPFLRSFGAVVVLGERMRDIFCGAVRPDRLKFVANFAEAAHFTSHDQIDAKFAAVDPVRMLFLSNPLPGKGHVEIVEAFVRLSPDVRRKLRIDFAGRFFDPVDEANFKKSIEPFEELRYLGTISGEPKRKALAEAHVFLLPTYYPYEGQPISILEAFASGCVVVTTDHSGIFDTFTDGQNGIAVEKESVEALQSAFEVLSAMDMGLHKIAHNNLDHATANFTTDRFLQDMRDIIQAVEEVTATIVP
jgi:glycosyltransferase involved in cell wall biosynthesis